MRHAWLLLFLCGCPSSGGGDDAGSGPPPADAAKDASAVCDTFTKVGDPCGPAGSTICFQECDHGGCQCKTNGSGGGVWTCTTDLSCVPEAGPLDDTGAPPPDDAALDAPDG